MEFQVCFYKNVMIKISTYKKKYKSINQIVSFRQIDAYPQQKNILYLVCDA